MISPASSSLPGWKGGHKTISVTPSVSGYTDWNVEVSSDGAGWLTATKHTGSTGIDLVAAKQPNTGSVSRRATVSFSDGQGTNTITVTQDARGVQTISSVSPSSFTFSADGTKYSADGTKWSDAPATVTVTTNDGETDWTVASSTWTPAPSKNGAALSFASPSAVTTRLDSKPAGKTTVTSYDGGSSKDITITQNRPLMVCLSGWVTIKNSEGDSKKISYSCSCSKMTVKNGTMTITVNSVE